MSFFKKNGALALFSATIFLGFISACLFLYFITQSMFGSTELFEEILLLVAATLSCLLYIVLLVRIFFMDLVAGVLAILLTVFLTVAMMAIM